MWILVGSKTRVRRIPDGRVVRRRCEDCDAVTEWAECDMLDRIELFFISMLDTKSRRFVCLQCGDDVHPDDVPPPTSRRTPSLPAAPPASARALPRAQAAAPPPPELPPRSSRDVATISARHVGPHHPEIDEEIAAIKRRLGKR